MSDFRLSNSHTRHPELLCRIDVNLNLAEVYQRMTPEQIAALFEGVGKVVAACSDGDRRSG